MPNFKFLNDITLYEHNSIKEVLEKFNKFSYLTGGKGFIFIVNRKKQVQGVLSEGDLRRRIIKNQDISQKIEKIYNQNFRFLYKNFDEIDLIDYFENFNSPLLILNNKHEVIDLILKDDLFKFKIVKYKRYYVKIPLRISFSGGGYDFTKQLKENNLKIFSVNINKYIHISLKLINSSKIKINNQILNKNYNFDSFKDINSRLIHNDLVLMTIKFFKPSYGFEMDITSDVHTGTGLGSSSAIVFGLAKIFNSKGKLGLNNLDLSSISYKIERIFFKIVGGWQDQLALTKAGFKLINIENKKISSKKLYSNDQFINQLQNNSIIVKFGKSRFSSDIQKKNLILKRNLTNQNKMTLNLVEKFEEGDYIEFSRVLKRIWAKKNLKFKNSKNIKLKNLYQTLENLNIDSFKMLGAGESGYIYILADRFEHDKILIKIKKYISSYERIAFDQNKIDVYAY